MKVILRFESDVQCPMCGGRGIMRSGSMCYNCNGRGAVTIESDIDITGRVKKVKLIWSKIIASR